MDPTEQRTFPARMAMLAQTAAFVETFCAAQGVSPEDALRAVLVVEELFTNTVAHGHRGDSDAEVTLVTYRDGVPVGLQPVTITTVGAFKVGGYIALAPTGNGPETPSGSPSPSASGSG